MLNGSFPGSKTTYKGGENLRGTGTRTGTETGTGTGTETETRTGTGTETGTEPGRELIQEQEQEPRREPGQEPERKPGQARESRQESPGRGTVMEREWVARDRMIRFRWDEQRVQGVRKTVDTSTTVSHPLIPYTEHRIPFREVQR